MKKGTVEVSGTTPGGVAASKPEPALDVPPLLLEGDAPSAPQVSGPGERYALGPKPTAAPVETGGEGGELPEGYGTERLHLTARDPHWVYAHWDLTREQLKHYNFLSARRHLTLRVYKNAVEGKPFLEADVHPESRNWFLNVDRGATKYVALLGYYSRENSQEWVPISTSKETMTPPDRPSEDVSASFETLPADLPFGHLIQLVKTAVSEHGSLLETIQQLRVSGFPGLPGQAIAAGNWTAEQERALAGLVTMDAVRRVWMGSLEITELIRRQFQQELSSAAAAQFSVPGSWSGAISSPLGGMERKKRFWFNINAELIIYGATEPDADVTIGGRAIQLRPDGTFSYRFALPDGHYHLPAKAVGADRSDSRSADLNFSRSTEYGGDVGKHPQDPELKEPLVENVA